MTSRRLGFVIGFCWTVAAVGMLVLVLTVREEGVAACAGAAFAALSVGVVVGEMVPVRLPLRGGEEETNLSTVFAFALLIHSGLAAAAVAQVAASLVQDVVARKPVWRAAFNAGQYVLCLAAASEVLSASGLHPGAGVGIATLRNVTAMVLAGGAFFAVNFLVVGAAVAGYQGTPLRTHLRNDLKTAVLMAGVSVSLAPLVLAALEQSPLLLALFVLPFIAVRRSGQLACDSAFQAMHDTLTGLPNRARFRRLVDEAIAGAEGAGRFAVMLLDLNRFKDINDTLGHHYGDLLLQTAASRLRGGLRDSDVVARLGGDEFAVLAYGEAPDAVAERLGGALRPVVELDGFLLELDASIGTARYPDDGTDLDTLLRRADVAMYTAKARNLGHVAYSAGIDEYDPARLALVADLRRGLEAEELVLYYQPKLDLRHRHVGAVEALVRWQHPRLGLLQPSAFVEMAEHTGLIKPLTHHVLRQALRQCAAWRADGVEIQVAVNVSPRSLLDRELAETVAAALEETGVAPAQLKLEITETAIMVDPDAALRVLNQLATMGVALSIDDFGTGYSSLAYLRRLPVDEVKIDRSFVENMARDDGDLAIVRSTIDLAANLGLAVVAEGVEDGETLEQLARLGCDEAQGYFIARPVPAAELAAWLTEQLTGQPSRWAAPAKTLTEAA
jgi:diguanylate cyclase (GGDEF)-like protein